MHLLITTDIFPPDIGGPASYVPLIAGELSLRGHTVLVLTYSRVPPQEDDKNWPFALRRIPLGIPRPLRLLRAVAEIWRLGWRAEVIYVNGLLVEVALANLPLGRPVVAKVVGDIAWERARHRGWASDDIETFQARQYGWQVELRRRLRDWALRRADRVIVPSAYLRGLVGRWHIPEERIVVIYNAFQPLDPRGFQNSAGLRPASIPLSTRYRIITVCRLTPWKGVDGLIEALAGLPDVGLVIVGEGPEREALEQLAEKRGVAGRVHFAGSLPRQQVAGYLQACNLFVLNSTYEGFPHAVLEAMAAGVPVVAADAGGTGEVVEDGVTGRLVPPQDTTALRQAITELMADRELRQRLAQAARERLSQFNLQRMVEQTEQELLAARQTLRISRPGCPRL
jgi:glycosyltransferase involved in cell wall biosynthesis